MKCSHCKMGTNCNNTTCICEASCEENWREPKCDGSFFFQFYFNDNETIRVEADYESGEPAIA